MADLRRQNGQDAPWNVKYWGIGNEMWGGGGNMRADYYSDLCRQYASFLRDYDPSHKIYKIASGACDFNYDWTQRVAELTGGAGRRFKPALLHHSRQRMGAQRLCHQVQPRRVLYYHV